MKRYYPDSVKEIIDGGGGAQTSCQERREKSCQTSRSINKLTFVDILHHYRSLGFQNFFPNEWLSQIFGDIKRASFFGKVGQFLAKFIVLFFSPFISIPTIIDSTLPSLVRFCYCVVPHLLISKTLQIKQLYVFSFFSSLKKTQSNCLVCKSFVGFPSSFNNHRLSLRNQSSGILLILLACFIPIILVSMKYSEKLFERRWKTLEVPDSNHVTKQCAKEAALAVARNYNPGLSLTQQKEALYKVADYVYNHTLSSGNSALTRAIPGIHLETKGSTSVGSVEKVISYTAAPKYLLTLQSTKSDASDKSTFATTYFHTLWLFADKSTDSMYHCPRFDEVNTKILPRTDYRLINEDFFCNLYADSSVFGYTIPSSTSTSDSAAGYNPADILATYDISQPFSTSSSKNGTYSIRSTGADAQCVDISIAEDAANLGKIKVQTDDDIAYAVPAACNLDIVLAIPTNSDACKCTGGDTTTSNIHQMAQACREFIKNHFFYTRGVYMSLIPYSGKLSISPDHLQDWTIAFPKYTVDPEQIFLIGACLYSTTGLKDASLSQESYDWGSARSGYPIMFRAGVAQTDTKYNNNPYFTGFLFDSSAPSTDDSYKYLRQNLNPCHIEHANLEQGLCTNNCPKYLANPYYMVEPTADITKIYEMLSALLPFSDSYNASNFIFPVFEWANNFFQGWTRDPGKNATSGGTDSETAQLGSQRKTTANRKKAIILLVNKPDWFEPGEMTYVGLYNDYQELHTQSDTIDFSIDFSDKSKRFADGRHYDGTIMGHKKLLQFEGTSTRDSAYYVEDRSTECVLKFPYKALIRLKVEQISANKEGSLKFTNLAISREGVAVNNDKYCVTTPMEFYVEADQLSEPEEADGLYHLNFEASNVRFLQADITNRKYSKYSLTRYAKVSGTGTILGTNIVSGTKTITLRTKHELPMQVKVEGVGDHASITLDGVTYNNITETMRKTFTNRGAAGYNNWNEGPNYSSNRRSQDFVACANLQNLTINAYLNNQSIYFPELINKNFSSGIFEFTFPLVISNGILHLSWCSAACRPPIVYFNGESIGSSKCINYEFHLNSNTPAVISWDGYDAHHDEGVPGVTNLDTVPFGTNPNANCVYLENGYFKYRGRGNLTVEILIPIYIKYTHPDGTEGKIDYGKVGTYSMTVDPEQFKYEGSSPYTIKLEMIGIERLSRLRTTEKRIVFEFWDDSEARNGAGNTVLRNYLGSDFTGNSSEDAATATKLSVDKMRATWGANLRIYVVKYNPELSYEEDGKTKNFDYSAVNACASDRGKVYEAKNAEELSAKFEMIWEDLREWTGYQEAKIVP